MIRKIEKILVIGGSGFIGYHIIKHANKLRYKIYSISKNKPLIKEKSVQYYYEDLTSSKSIINIIKNNDFTYVINASGYIDHSNFYKNGHEVILNYVKIMNNVLTNLSLNRLKKFINIGSSDSYGLSKGPQSEDSSDQPFSSYSLAKFYNFELLKMMNRVHNLPFIELRLFLVYGPYQKKDRFIPQMISAFLRNDDFKCTKANQIRDFCYIDDVINAIFLSLKSKKINGQAINIGSGEKVKVKKVIEITKKIIGKGNPIYGSLEYKPLENMKLYPNLKKQYKLLPTWKAKIDLRTGLMKTIKFYKNDSQ